MTWPLIHHGDTVRKGEFLQLFAEFSGLGIQLLGKQIHILINLALSPVLASLGPRGKRSGMWTPPAAKSLLLQIPLFSTPTARNLQNNRRLRAKKA